MATEFGIRQNGEWVPCAPELCQWLDRSMDDLAVGLPGSVIVRGPDGEAHPLSGAARHVLFLALCAMNARMSPKGYKPRAPEIYAALARGGLDGPDGMAELREVFDLTTRPVPGAGNIAPSVEGEP